MYGIMQDLQLPRTTHPRSPHPSCPSCIPHPSRPRIPHPYLYKIKNMFGEYKKSSSGI